MLYWVTLMEKYLGTFTGVLPRLEDSSALEPIAAHWWCDMPSYQVKHLE